MSQTNIFRPGIDVTEAVLLPQMTWRRQEKTETVGGWKCKVYDMHNVVVKSEELNDILTDEERKQLEAALKLDPSDACPENSDVIIGHRHKTKKSWFEGWRKRDSKHERPRKGTGAPVLPVPPRGSLCIDEKVSDLLGDSPSTSQSQIQPGRRSMEITVKDAENKRVKDSTANW
ncbi:ankyrin repeat domain-containing protein 13C [Tanacetum coccineum]